MSIGTSQAGDHRLFLLGLSLSRLTSVMILVLVSGFFMTLNSSYLLVSAGLLWVLSRWWSPSKSVFLIFLGLGLFLFGMELSLRQSSLMFSSAFFESNFEINFSVIASHGSAALPHSQTCRPVASSQ
jgi:hypothetical protein